MPKQQIITLNSPQGNAFALMGVAQSLARKLGKDGEAIQKEMMAGDYDDLLKVFEREFGQYVKLVR
jgi:hypothetical protein